jgi:hypothetical protein
VFSAARSSAAALSRATNSVAKCRDLCSKGVIIHVHCTVVKKILRRACK